MTLQGRVSANGQESSRELNLGGQIGADRITNTWKITTGLEIDYRREDFDLDEDDPLRALRSCCGCGGSEAATNTACRSATDTPSGPSSIQS